jgi:hypothetical protein
VIPLPKKKRFRIADVSAALLVLLQVQWLQASTPLPSTNPIAMQAIRWRAGSSQTAATSKSVLVEPLDPRSIGHVLEAESSGRGRGIVDEGVRIGKGKEPSCPHQKNG